MLQHDREDLRRRYLDWHQGWAARPVDYTPPGPHHWHWGATAIEWLRAAWILMWTAEELNDTYDGLNRGRLARHRNYELEERLNVLFGGGWGIDEYCPFNGRFCAFGTRIGEYT